MANELPHRNGPIPAVNLPFEPQQIGVKGCNRYDRQQRGLLIQKTIDDMDREVTERRDIQRAMRPRAPPPPEGELRDAIDDILEVTIVCRELDAALAEGRKPSAEALAILIRWETEIQEEDDELELDAAKAALEE